MDRIISNDMVEHNPATRIVASETPGTAISKRGSSDVLDFGMNWPSLPDGLPLLPHHLAELNASGLTEKTIKQNGIYSESDPAKVSDLLNMGIELAHTIVPVLVYPHFDQQGVPLNHATVKPDKPRKHKGKDKVIKYENPWQRPNRVYIPNDARVAVSNPTADLSITEGCKKALGATQAGFPCISLPGVWNWVKKRTVENGKKVGPIVLNESMASISWRGRRVFIIYDSDWEMNKNVAAAASMLAKILAEEGAMVHLIRLLQEPDGKKNGLDDFLVRHGGDELAKLITTSIKTPASDTDIDPCQLTEGGYIAHRRCIYHCIINIDPETGEKTIQKYSKLSNFIARIRGETVTDDGAEQTRTFSIEAILRDGSTRVVEIPVGEFRPLDWVIKKLGPQFVIQAGSGKYEHLRCAIQELSGNNFSSKTVYTHTGWREINGKWHYLHANGAIGSSPETADNVKVQLEGTAAEFALPTPPQGQNLIDSVQASLGLLENLAPDLVMFTILATVYRATIGGTDYSLWLSGPTGAQKSELAALAQQHFGATMNRNRLPANWTSTDNSLEARAFHTKDAILVIDDYAPSANKSDADRQHRTAERLIRGQGNHAGRQRMNPDGTLRPEKPPRCLILATGEDVPKTNSIIARLCIVTIERGSVNLEGLSRCQVEARDGKYAAAMAGFIRWLTYDYARIKSGLERERALLRDQFVGRFSHARTPDIIANLLIGLGYLLRYAKDINAIDSQKHDALWEKGMAVFGQLANQQAEFQRVTDPVAMFPEMLLAILSSGRGHLLTVMGKVPPSPETWGWERKEQHVSFEVSDPDYQSRGKKIGWIDGEEIYLDPVSLYAALNQFSNEQGQTYALTKSTLPRRLKEAKMLVRYEGDRTTYPQVIEGDRRRVLVIRKALLFDEPGKSG